MPSRFLRCKIKREFGALILSKLQINIWMEEDENANPKLYPQL
jgi:hypothetical protein